MGIICFSDNVRQYSIACSVVHVQLCTTLFLVLFVCYHIAILPAMVRLINKEYLRLRLVSENGK